MRSIMLLITGLEIVACEPNRYRQPSQEAIQATPAPSQSLAPSTATSKDVKAALLKAGFPQNEIQTMLCIGWCESKFNTNARGLNVNSSDDGRYNWGLFQINGVHLKTCGFASGTELFNLENNTNCALKVRKASGFQAWAVYYSCLQPPSDPTKIRCT